MTLVPKTMGRSIAHNRFKASFFLGLKQQTYCGAIYCKICLVVDFRKKILQEKPDNDSLNESSQSNCGKFSKVLFV